MEAQTPAEGILKTNEWGDSKMYFVRCDCTDDDHAHDIEVEADDHSVQVTIYTKSYTKWNEKGRWKQIWQILTKGYAETSTSILLKEQVAMNYAETLKAAALDVKEFKEKWKIDKSKKS